MGRCIAQILRGTEGDSAPDEPSLLRDQAGRVDSYCQEHGWRLLELVHDNDDGNGKGSPEGGQGESSAIHGYLQRGHPARARALKLFLITSES